MSLSDLAALGSFVSGLAVVITLVFLGIQLRQANRNQRSLMQQGRTARVAESILRCTEPFLSESMVGGFGGDVALEAPKIQAFIRQLSALLYNYEDSFLQYRAGTLEGAGWATDEAALHEFFAYPGFRVAWRFNRNFMTGEFRDHVDGIMRATRGTQTLDLTTFWKTALAEESALRAAQT